MGIHLQKCLFWKMMNYSDPLCPVHKTEFSDLKSFSFRSSDFEDFIRLQMLMVANPNLDPELFLIDMAKFLFKTHKFQMKLR